MIPVTANKQHFSALLSRLTESSADQRYSERTRSRPISAQARIIIANMHNFCVTSDIATTPSDQNANIEFQDALFRLTYTERGRAREKEIPKTAQRGCSVAYDIDPRLIDGLDMHKDGIRSRPVRVPLWSRRSHYGQWLPVRHFPTKLDEDM